MQTVQNDSLADIRFSLVWEQDNITHKDSYMGCEVNLWQDYLPEFVRKAVTSQASGATIGMGLSGPEPVPAHQKRLVRQIRLSQLDMARVPGMTDVPQKGRFYPKGILKDISGIHKQNITPFRFIEKNGRTAKVDFNHPLAGVSPRLDVEIQHIIQNDRKLGGSSVDWLDRLVTGPGMQTRYGGEKTDFFTENALKRDDEQDDGLFYEGCRMVSHIDETAQKVLKQVYGKLLKSGSTVLDLMASWQSHLPEDLDLSRLSGLGMNRHELLANSRLSDFVVHDLNRNPVLPYPEARFDAVICSLSVEYLTRPFDVFSDVARILKPGGTFIVTFSNRWFPPKAINIWKHIHEFERMAVVTEYFLESGRFHHLHTLSERGYPRPYTDKYFPQMKDADPIYAVYGTRF